MKYCIFVIYFLHKTRAILRKLKLGGHIAFDNPDSRFGAACRILVALLTSALPFMKTVLGPSLSVSAIFVVVKFIPCTVGCDRPVGNVWRDRCDFWRPTSLLVCWRRRGVLAVCGVGGAKKLRERSVWCSPCSPFGWKCREKFKVKNCP